MIPEFYSLLCPDGKKSLKNKKPEDNTKKGAENSQKSENKNTIIV